MENDRYIPPENSTLTDGSPVPKDGSHRELDATGQQKGYVVLSTEERAKGFVRPVRRTYQHVGVRPKNNTRELTEAERQRYAGCSYAAYEEYPKSEGSLAVGQYWTTERLMSGCGSDTTMGQAIAETYARNPKFYSGTFCCRCGKHYPLKEFVWKGTNEVVGS